jgi:transposase-like protein
MCHVKSGEELRLPGEIGSKVMAPCAHEPLESRKHEFLRVRGNRYRCHICHQDTFVGKDGYRLSQLNVVGEAKGA